MNREPFDWLFSLAQFGIKFGLDNIRTIVAEFEHPERAYPSLHVAGTNGKGSVAAMTEAALRAAGLRTGRYTSPHLLDLTERFAIDGQAVEVDALRATVADVQRAVVRLQASGMLETHPTFFEVTTATAFELFRRSKVDIAICEVGLGGRLDATNVLSPLACAITSIGFDHEQYLGRTIRDIALEKAGIIKPSTPVVVGSVDAESAAAIRETADAVSAPIVWATDGVDLGPSTRDEGGVQRFDVRTPVRDYGEVRLALAGEHQVRNALVAVRLLETTSAIGVRVDGSAIAHGLSTVHWPGRLQHVALAGGRGVILDAAHNAAGADALARYLASSGPPRPLVFAAMRDKDIGAMLRALSPVASALIITLASNPRSADPSEVEAIARTVAPTRSVEVVPSPALALERAWSLDDHVVVAGSIFLLADVMRSLERT